jgi:hypothetical protein
MSSMHRGRSCGKSKKKNTWSVVRQMRSAGAHGSPCPPASHPLQRRCLGDGQPKYVLEPAEKDWAEGLKGAAA